MANRYFYNGKLVRTSEHEYTHGVTNEEGVVFACRPSYEKAHSVITSEIAKANSFIKEYRSLLKAINEGRKTYEFKVGNRRVIAPVENHNVNEVEGWIEGFNKHIEKVSNSWKVVELERR